MTEITKDRDFKTNINIESQTIKYALNPESFKEDLQIAIIEGKATGRTVVKTIDNVINGDKSQDIGEAERRSLIEIKEAVVRLQTSPAMDIIAEEDLTDKNVQARLGVVIEKFNPNDPSLSKKVKERLNELKAEGKEIVAFYDKITGKIFLNHSAKEEEVRASIAREYKIKEDLELGRGKANEKGQLRSTVAGEIAYDEIKNRLKKGDKNPINASHFEVAKMDKNSEVTSDKYGEQVEGIKNIIGSGMEFSAQISEMNDNPNILYKDPEGAKKKAATALDKLNKDYNKNVDSMIEGWHRPEYAEKELPILKEKIEKEKNPEMKNLFLARYGYLEKEAHPFNTLKENLNKAGVKGFITGAVIKTAMNTAQGRAITLGIIGGKALYNTYQGTKEEPKIAITSKQADDIKRIAPEFYKDAESSFIIRKESEVSDSVLIGAAEHYYKNSKTPDGKTGDIIGFLAGAKVGGDFAGTLNRPSLYIYKQPNPSLVPVNELTNGGQFLLRNNTNSMLPVAYKAENTALVLYKNPNLLPAPVGTNGALVTAPLLLTDGANKQGMVVNKLGKGPLDIEKAPGLDTISEGKLIKFQYEVSKAGTKLDLKTGELIGPKGGKGKVVGTTLDGKIVANMAGRNVIFENGKQNPVSAGSLKKFEIPKTNEVVEVPSEAIAKNNAIKPSENMFNGLLDKAKSKITGKPVAQVQLERIGIKSEVKDIGLKVDGTTPTGLDIDEALKNNLGRTFKTYDNYDDVTKTATSVKSIDMTSKTYTSGSGLKNTLNSYKRDMKNFTKYELDKVKLENKDIENRILKIVINNEPLNKSQMENLKKFVEAANKDGIKVEAVILK
ncbi:hypothetical protein FUSO5_06025 [Fusobacterium necrophorum BFTR-1]|uniref:endonuclease toxin domain-containing protein n=1 Tax=Fusobacterium necrophorum TaxID=859 RepID=UPI000460FECC|nr:hypothetical protein [Fusobacterium necrophorum]KDE64589.1 hypothetical protein FUSO5_06025 [Fusobacterium necrophorum BFTR-1]